MTEVYQQNRPIEGGYDAALGAVCKNGTFIGCESEGVTSFKGIPFARPPIGDLRWKEPVIADDRDGVFEALHNGPSAIQTKLDSERASFYFQSEDCLYLNVWTAVGFAQEKRPVMVFIHGGNYGWGGTADPLYDGHNFVKAHPDIVLVSIAYRLGIFGFMDFSRVPGGEDYSFSGNLGLLDQICALRYIKENIRGFGGDPENVTIFGESAGGGSVSLLPLIRSAKGLFNRVIAQSGSVALTYSREETLPLTRDLLKQTGAKSMAQLCALSEEELKSVNEKVGQINNFPERDGVILPEDPYAAYQKGEALPVDMLIGTNADELRYWIFDIGGIGRYRFASELLLNNILKQLDKTDRQRVKTFLQTQAKKGISERMFQITELFNELLFRLPAVAQAEAHAANRNRVYQYYWTYPSSLPDLKACHAVELSYVFGNTDETIYTGPDPNRQLAKLVQQMWVNFAKTGNPSVKEEKWAPYTKDNRNTMLIGDKTVVKSNWRETERACLEPLLKYRVNGNSASSNPGVFLILKTAATALAARIASWFSRPNREV